GVEQIVEAPPFVGAPAQQRLQTPAQHFGLQHIAVLRRAQGRHRIGPDGETVGAQEGGKTGEALRHARANRVHAQHAAANRATTSRGNAARSSRVLISALNVSTMRSTPLTSITDTFRRSSAAAQSSVSAMPGFFWRSMRRTACTNATICRASAGATSGAFLRTIASSLSWSG